MAVGDFLVFHVFRKVAGIVAVYRVISELFEENSNVWGKDRYPLRVKIEPVKSLSTDEKNPIPISCIFGTISSSDVVIEPFLKNRWIIRMNTAQFDRVRKLLEIKHHQEK